MAFSPDDFIFNEWLCKTHFSFLRSTSSPKSVLENCIKLKYNSICINDFDGVYGLARAYNDLNFLTKNSTASLKLNYGTEIHLFPDHEQPLIKQITITLNAFNHKGYSQICSLLSQAHQDSKDEAYLSLNDLLQRNLSDTFAIIPMRGGFVHFKNKLNELKKLKSFFNNRIYFAVTKTFHPFLDQNIRSVYQLSKTFDVPTLFSQDIFMSHSSEKSFHDLITAIKINKTIDTSLSHHLPNGELSFHSTRELYRIYSQFPDFKKTIKKMQELNDQCQFSFSELKYQYPKEMIPKGFSSLTYLEHLTWKYAKAFYNQKIPDKVRTILKKELLIIAQLKFADYFLTVWDIVNWARSQSILCQGRGSAANSAVCFFLKITSCDPNSFDLLFERFVSKERGDPPDIDVDFEHERREEVIQYIYQRYGRKRSAMVANVITFKRKGALRSVAKALGISTQTQDLAAKVSSSVHLRKGGLVSVLNEVRKQSSNNTNSTIFSLWLYFSTRLLDTPRHMGLHSGGFIISQNSLDELCPQEPATMTGRTVIQWCKDDIEELGFFKIDCLALGMLTAIQKCFQFIAKNHKKTFHLYSIPQNDPETYKMIQKADTVGVFQIESRAQMSMLPRLKPQNFYDLVIEIAIIRPGPIQGKVIHPYLRRRQGLEAITYPNPEVKKILEKTLGIIIFQEQLMQIAICLGDFSPGEANELRKNIGAWNSKKFNRNLDPYTKKLLNSLKKKKLNSTFIKQIVEQMKGFSEYGFPESHAISFAFIAYASCYLKCHYPAEFFTAVLNSQPMGFYSPHALLRTAKKSGVKVLPLSVNHSSWDHTLEKLQGTSKNANFAIRLGFRIVSGLRKSAISKLESERKISGPWKSLDHFIKHNSLHRNDYSFLAAANAFFELQIDRINALWQIESLPFKPLIDTPEQKINWRKKTNFENAQADFASFGTTLAAHPVYIICQEAWPYTLSVKSIKKSIQLEKLTEQTVFVFGLILSKQAPPSAKGMVFYTLEDETGFINLAFPPHVYKKYFRNLEGSTFLCIQGLLQKVSGYHSILVKKVLEKSSPAITKLNKKSRSKKMPKQESSQISLKPRSYF